MTRKEIRIVDPERPGTFIDPETNEPVGNPIVRCLLWLRPSDVDYFDGNPRRSENPLYEEIKASILRLGDLEQPIPISRDPATKKLVVYKGGNTRLRIIKEAWRNGDERFRSVCFDYHPWQGWEVGAIAHIAENELRGGLRLIDKALLVKRIQEHLEATVYLKYAAHHIAYQCAKRGWPVETTSIKNYLLAAKYYSFCPLALDGGAGVSFVKGISKFESSLDFLSNHLGEPFPECSDLLDLFHRLLKNIDSANLTLSTIESALLEKLGSLLKKEPSVMLAIWKAAGSKSVEELLPLLTSVPEKKVRTVPEVLVRHTPLPVAAPTAPTTTWSGARQSLLKLGSTPGSRVTELPDIFEQLDAVDDLRTVRVALDALIAEREAAV